MISKMSRVFSVIEKQGMPVVVVTLMVWTFEMGLLCKDYGQTQQT